MASPSLATAALASPLLFSSAILRVPRWPGAPCPPARRRALLHPASSVNTGMDMQFKAVFETSKWFACRLTSHPKVFASTFTPFPSQLTADILVMMIAVRARDRHGGRKGGRGGGTGGGIRLPARSETTLPPKSALRIIFLDSAVEVAGAAPPPVVAAALVCCTLRQHLLLPPSPLSLTPIHREILPEPHHGVSACSSLAL